jgi:hypothetical protein
MYIRQISDLFIGSGQMGLYILSLILSFGSLLVFAQMIVGLVRFQRAAGQRPAAPVSRKVIVGAGASGVTIMIVAVAGLIGMRVSSNPWIADACSLFVAMILLVGGAYSGAFKREH